ncbi:chorismate mutase [Skermania sp. ID1734]|uniref:chorismate mutase n=1 Tax=Skermania sp. ID1734 TaxID=2597516 RepID=UPI00163D96E6|nr:chorismate mutase [Skermania sp. ID1734]
MPGLLVTLIFTTGLTFWANGLAHAAPANPLTPLVTAVVQRLETADAVAAAKYPAGPIDDPAREQQVLESVRIQALREGVDPIRADAVFRDQIEANKLVQRALFTMWSTRLASPPVHRPDLSGPRKQIDTANGAMVTQLRAVAVSLAEPSCPLLLTDAVATQGGEQGLDALHVAATARAVRSLCN